MTSGLRIGLALCFLATAIATAAQETPAKHARVELLSRQSAVAAGSEIQMGVHFQLDPGWHIYWVNPGDSGQPPAFKWKLPAGFTADEIQWPRPERIQTNPQIADYGYHGDVLLIVPIHVPQVTNADSDKQDKLQFAAEAKWLICREVCIPEHAQLGIALPISAKATEDPSAAKLFAETRRLLPRSLPRGWNVTARSTHDDFVLAVAAGKRILKAEFFPLDPGQIDNSAPQKIQPTPTGAKITLKRSDILLKPITVLRGVLVIAGGPAYRIEAPVRQKIQ
ncbi:MAG TPA: protein-disulfide reductase DsbD domain-containing protein [Candidatus Angelobacter sp.]